jgi:hypothetical protein
MGGLINLMKSTRISMENKDDGNEKDLSIEDKMEIVIQEIQLINSKLELLATHSHDSSGRPVVPF